MTPEQRQAIIDRVLVKRDNIEEAFVMAYRAWSCAKDMDQGATHIANRFGRMEALASILGVNLTELVTKLQDEGRIRA